MADAFPVHHLEQLAGDGGGRVDETDRFPTGRPGVGIGYLAEGVQQEGVVRTAQNDGIGTFLQQGLQALANHSLGVRTTQLAGLYQLHETLSHMLRDADVILVQALGVEAFGGGERAGRGQDADHARLRTQGRRLDGRLHADETDAVQTPIRPFPQRFGGLVGELGPQSGDGGGGGRVAGDHDDVRAPAHQQFGNRACALANKCVGLAPIGTESVVGEVDILLRRQESAYLPVHRKTARSGIENTDVCHP